MDNQHDTQERGPYRMPEHIHIATYNELCTEALNYLLMHEGDIGVAEAIGRIDKMQQYFMLELVIASRLGVTFTNPIFDGSDISRNKLKKTLIRTVGIDRYAEVSLELQPQRIILDEVKLRKITFEPDPRDIKVLPRKVLPVEEEIAADGDDKLDYTPYQLTDEEIAAKEREQQTIMQELRQVIIDVWHIKKPSHALLTKLLKVYGASAIDFASAPLKLSGDNIKIGEADKDGVVRICIGYNAFNREALREGSHTYYIKKGCRIMYVD